MNRRKEEKKNKRGIKKSLVSNVNTFVKKVPDVRNKNN